MSTAIAKNFQVGTSGTATDNFTIRQPATPDGTVRIANGNSGTTNDLVTLTSAGNVGIGTSSPGVKFAVRTSGTEIANFSSSLSNSNNWISVGSQTSSVTLGVNTDNTAYLYTGTQPLTFLVAGSEKARIDSSGNLLVGTTSTTGPGGAGVVAGTFRTLSGGGGLNHTQSATLFNIPANTTYLVTAQTANASGLSTVVLVTFTSGGNPAVRTILMQDSGAFFISMSGANVQLTNNLGGIIAYQFTAMRIF